MAFNAEDINTVKGNLKYMEQLI